MAAVSRIFVRNLPPSLTEPEFKSHFSATAPITDSKLISHRRIGYVGYKTPEAAAKAVKYFNKSFIRMSRIGVELAKSFGEVSGIRRAGKPGPERDVEGEAAADERPAKRPKVADEETKKNDPKLQEFLEVMQPSKKSRTWADGLEGMGSTEEVTAELPVGAHQEAKSDDEYEHVPKKRKRETEDVEKPPEPAVVDEASSEFQGLGDAENQVEEQAPAEEAPPKSDVDWLRSRTSRLLGLLDDEEIDAQAIAPPDPEKGAVSKRQEGSSEKKSDSGTQTDGENEVAEGAASTNEDGNEGETSLPQEREPSVYDTGRLFIRNLSYETTQDDLQDYVSQHGQTEEVHIAHDPRTGTSKGFAYVQYRSRDDAPRAIQELDGKPFQGRLLHVMPAAAKKEFQMDDFAISQLPHKKQQQIRRKQEATSSTFRWNTLYMNPDAVMSSIADRLQVPKSVLLDPTSSDAAVRQAHAETNIIQETKAYLSANGVNLDAFQRKEFSETAILVKNFPYGTTAAEIRQQFETYGRLTKLLMPPSGTIAIVEFDQPGQARTAFRSLSYRKFRDSILFLEKAPKEIFNASTQSAKVAETKIAKDSKLSASDLLEEVGEPEVGISSTLFVRNLNFATAQEDLHNLFKPLKGFKSARIKTKTDPKRPGQILSMGFGFVEFRSKEDARSARAALDGYRLDGHSLVIKESHKALDAAEERRKEDAAKKVAARRTKVIIKNLPFEATRKDVQQLFGPYGKLRSVRVPKKFDSSTRGFAFADFVTAKEAENAMEALSGTHLLGRRLNLDFAAEDAIDPEEEIERMSKKVGKQADKVALQRLTGGGRKKFSINKEDDDVD